MGERKRGENGSAGGKEGARSREDWPTLFFSFPATSPNLVSRTVSRALRLCGSPTATPPQPPGQEKRLDDEHEVPNLNAERVGTLSRLPKGPRRNLKISVLRQVEKRGQELTVMLGGAGDGANAEQKRCPHLEVFTIGNLSLSLATAACHSER